MIHRTPVKLDRDMSIDLQFREYFLYLLTLSPDNLNVLLIDLIVNVAKEIYLSLSGHFDIKAQAHLHPTFFFRIWMRRVEPH